MFLNKYSESQKEAMERLENELSSFTHDDIVVEVKAIDNAQIDIEGRNSFDRARRDVGH